MPFLKPASDTVWKEAGFLNLLPSFTTLVKLISSNSTYCEFSTVSQLSFLLTSENLLMAFLKLSDSPCGLHESLSFWSQLPQDTIYGLWPSQHDYQ